MSQDTPGRRRAGISSVSIRRPIGTVMLTSVVLVLGGFFLSGLPLDLLPSIVYPRIRASVNNPGVEPQVLEETVAKPLEAALSVTEDLTRIETEIQQGRVGVNLHFNYGTNIDFALQDAAKNLERARGRLPEEADPPRIYKYDPAQSPVFEVAFSSPTRDLISLRDWVENRLRPQLLTIEGVASVDVAGGLIREIQVVLDPARLRSYGLTVLQVIAALRAANQDVAAGRLSSETLELVGKTAGKFRSVDEIRGVLLNLPNGGRIPLTEVAAVRDTSREQRFWARLNGVPGVRMSIRKQPDANTVTAADGAEQRLRSLAAGGFFPPDIDYVILRSQADFIRNSVKSVRDAALIGSALAMLVVLLFLGSLRKTFIIGTAIPIAIMATFFMMGLGDLTLNIMSLGGLALGVGLLIDNSIVMLENIFRRREEGIEDPEEAAHEGAAEVQSALVASTSTNLAAVVPFLLISGLAALIFRELILTISFAIAASLFVALTLVPMLAAQLARVRFTSGVEHWKPLVAVDRLVDAGRRGYRRIGPRVLRWRWAVLSIAVLSLVGAWATTRNLGSEFLPQVDNGDVGVYFRLPPGSTAPETNRVALEIEALVAEMPYVRHVFTNAGGFGFGGSTTERAGRGFLTISIGPPSERDMKADAWVQQLQAKVDARGFPGARIYVRPPRLRGLRTSSSGEDVAITIQGDDLAALQRIGLDILARVQGVPGLENMQPSAEDASPELAIELERERAAYLGLDVATVGQTVRTALDGTIATRYTEGNKEYDVRVMFERERFQSPEDVAAIALFPGLSGAPPIYLRDVARVYTALGPTSIDREDQNRIFRLTGDVLTEVASVGEVNDAVRARLAGYPLPDGYSLIYGGEEEAIRENNRQLAIVVMLAIFLVFVVMAVQYESVVNPFVILLAIPLSLVGVGLALWIGQVPLSAPVLLGVILLAGIVVNNAILLVEYTENFRSERGGSLEEAVIDAGAVRLRPILMTTLTTCLGMTPLALGIGEGSEMMQPLAVAVVGGLSVSTLLTLFVVPCAYVIFNRGAERLRAWVTGRPSTREIAPAPAAAAGRPEAALGD